VIDRPQDGEGNQGWARLRRRKVVQWGIAYAAGAWGLLQGLQFLVDAFEWPSRVLQLGTVAAALGLPIVLVLAWYHDDRGHQKPVRSELAIIALLLLVGGGALWLYGHRNTPAQTAATSATPSPAPKASTAPADNRPSIAVLPFENRSDQEKDAFFVDGIHDDILTQLGKVGALKVISRTSVERFRDTTLPIKEIAQQLGVTKILEGGVQRAGDRVRVTVQLIDAPTDSHLWAETYDRELTAANIFAIQSEVAATIARALQAALTPAERASVEAIPTQNLGAWEAFQLGRQRQRMGTTESIKEAASLFRKAAGLDGNFALAHVGLAECLFSLAYRGAPLQSTLEQSREALARASALAPNLSEVHAMAGKLAESRGDYASAEAEYRAAIELNANNATALLRYSALLPDFGRAEEAVRFAERAAQLDPVSISAQTNLGRAFVGVARFEDSVKQFERAITIDPRVPSPYVRLAQTYATAYGRLDDAVRWQQKVIELDPDDPAFQAELAAFYLDLGELEAARRWLDSAMKDGVHDSITAETATFWHLYRGEDARARDFARRAFEISPRHSPGLQLLRNFDLAARDPQRARERYEQVNPELLGAKSPKIDGTNFLLAIDLSLVLQRTGETRRADELLQGSLQFARSLPRMGFLGSNMAYVQILALLGQKPAALGALRELAKSGYAEEWRYYRDFDPNLASIRNEPGFKAVFADIERNMARQRAELAKRPRDAPFELQ
jgi:TolB-like protein/Tfp pilus assembly protein PilF